MNYENIGTRSLVNMAKERNLPATFTMTKSEVISMLVASDNVEKPEIKPEPEMSKPKTSSITIELDPDTYAEVLLLSRQSSMTAEATASAIVRQRFFGRTMYSSNQDAQKKIKHCEHIFRHF